MIVFALLAFSGCKKEDDFLNAKPSADLAIPTTLIDLQLLLQNEGTFNNNDPGLGTLSSDEYYCLTSTWTSAATAIERNVYIWAKQVYDATSANVLDWTNPYGRVYHANVVLDALPIIKYTSSEQNSYNQIKGAALFFRSMAFYSLVQTFAMPYDSAAAGTEAGIPLRLNSDLNTVSTRQTVKECYDQIISDLKTAIQLLPLTSSTITQPNKIAAYAALARIYLSMAKYGEAFAYADTVLQHNHVLVDYNTLSASSLTLTGAKTYLSEDIFHSVMIGYGIYSITKGIVDSNLYQLYGPNDLRRAAFFVLRSGYIRFKGSYEVKRPAVLYTGLATDEMVLIHAECNARMGNVTAAMNDLNYLLVNRYKTGTFVPRTAVDQHDALQQILAERRKELLFRGLRWTDLRRLNKEVSLAITLSRIINGSTYTLPPNDGRYALPIPNSEISIDGIGQNNR
jgi:hypothetical protein